MRLTLQVNTAKDGKVYWAVHAEDVSVSGVQLAVDRLKVAQEAMEVEFGKGKKADGAQTPVGGLPGPKPRYRFEVED